MRFFRSLTFCRSAGYNITFLHRNDYPPNSSHLVHCRTHAHSTTGQLGEGTNRNVQSIHEEMPFGVGVAFERDEELLNFSTRSDAHRRRGRRISASLSKVYRAVTIVMIDHQHYGDLGAGYLLHPDNDPEPSSNLHALPHEPVAFNKVKVLPCGLPLAIAAH